MAKRPISTVTKSTPVVRNGTPKTKRSTPYWASVPMVPRNMPAKSEISAAGSEDWFSTETPARPNTTTEKNSTLESVSAKRAKGGAKKARKSALTSPPTAEDMMASPSAYWVAPLPAQLVALPGGGHVHGVARDVEEDAGDRAPEDAAAVDADHEQQRGDDAHQVGERQHQHDRVEHGDAGQRAGQDADDQAERDHAQVQRLQRVLEPDAQAPNARSKNALDHVVRIRRCRGRGRGPG